MKIDDILTFNQNKYWIKSFKHQRMSLLHSIGKPNQSFSIEELQESLIKSLKDHFDSIKKLNSDYKAYQYSLNQAETITEKQEEMLNFCRILGSNEKEIKKARKSFNRYFGADVITERFNYKLEDHERIISYVLRNYFNFLSSYKIQIPSSYINKIIPFYESAIKYNKSRDFISRWALDGLLKIKENINFDENKSLKELLRELAVSYEHETWIVSKSIEFWPLHSPESFDELLNLRLVVTKKNKVSDLFIRRRIYELLIKNKIKAHDYLELLTKDPSSYVKQKIPYLLIELKNYSLAFSHLNNILKNKESCPFVKRSIWINLVHFIKKSPFIFFNIFENSLMEKDEITQRFSIEAFQKSIPYLEGDSKDKAFDLLLKIKSKTEFVSAKREITYTTELIWIYSKDENLELYKKLKDELLPNFDNLKANLKIEIRNELINASLRILSFICHKDWPLDIKIKKKKNHAILKLRRGFRFKRRWWRFWHEIKIGRPDKRQAFTHTIARKNNEKIRINSGILSETNVTVVPGEPLFIPEENGYRSFLPLLDDFLPSNKSIKETTIYSIHGKVNIQYSHFFLTRFINFLRLSNNFEKVSELRNWRSFQKEKANSYTEKVREFNVSIEYQPFEKYSDQNDNEVTKFFSLMPFLNYHYNEISLYIISIYRNSLLELGIFITLLISFFLVKHKIKFKKILRIRENISLVIGGWGSRGKSGTERIKAALFHGLNFKVTSKTTGCEAMFVHSMPKGALKEIFLFRPYDKATIWEQIDILNIASKLDSDLFLWECMGLTPDYVRTLQEQWTKDDLSTITNAHPDHEDIQGPAGFNVANVMTEFIPRESQVFTAEEQMIPVLRDGALKKKTSFHATNWYDQFLIPNEILKLFPYEEHPSNIALVCKLVEELDVKEDFALKAMADNVVPDLGVLKEFSPAKTLDRNLAFINGHSANERFAATGNWKRMGLMDSTLEDNPDWWITTVINNRADRIPRSQVFASLCAEVLYADRHILIGTNQSGFKNYLKDSWEKHCASFPFWDALESNENIINEFEKVCLQLRVYTQEKTIKKRIQNTLSQLKLNEKFERIEDSISIIEKSSIEKKHKENILEIIQSEIDIYNEQLEFKNLLLQRKIDKNKCEEKFTKWFMRRLVQIPDASATSDDIVKKIVSISPPGGVNKVMGIQNIKGTGLGFAYSWEDWGECKKLIEDALSEEKYLKKEALSSLALKTKYNLQSQESIKDLIVKLRDNINGLNEEESSLLDQIEGNLLESESSLQSNAELKEINLWHKFLSHIKQPLEDILDPIDAIKRRRKADQIYKDLMDKLISHDTAARELQELTKRQKGGWLKL